MAEILLTNNKGRKSTGNEQQFQEGFLRNCPNCIYMPDDDHNLHKIPGRTSAGSTPSNPRDFVFMKFDEKFDMLVVLDAGGNLYEQRASTTLSSWTTVQDKQGSPENFLIPGHHLKTISDGRRLNLAWGSQPALTPAAVSPDDPLTSSDLLWWWKASDISGEDGDAVTSLVLNAASSFGTPTFDKTTGDAVYRKLTGPNGNEWVECTTDNTGFVASGATALAGEVTVFAIYRTPTNDEGISTKTPLLGNSGDSANREGIYPVGSEPAADSMDFYLNDSVIGLSTTSLEGGDATNQAWFCVVVRRDSSDILESWHASQTSVLRNVSPGFIARVGTLNWDAIWQDEKSLDVRKARLGSGLAEIIVFDRALNNREVEYVYNYLANRHDFPSFPTKSDSPLIRDEDGNWRVLGMATPLAPSLTAVTVSGAPVSPNAHSNPATVLGGIVPDKNFDDAANAYDGDFDTSALGTVLDRVGWYTAAQDYQFPSTAMAANYNVVLQFAAATLINGPIRITIQKKTSAAGAWTTIWTTDLTGSGNWVVEHIITPGEIEFSNLSSFQLRIVTQDLSGGGGSYKFFSLYEIYATSVGAGRASGITTGDYTYAITEVYSVELDSGKIITVEGPPSTIATISLDSGTDYGVSIALPDRANLASAGYTHDVANGLTLQRRIYRSTTGGSYPDLGLIATVGINETVYVDTFGTAVTPTEAILGTPTINVVFLEDTFFNAAERPPAFLDATLHRGAVVAIPRDDQFLIAWSIPGSPDYWPIPQAFSFTSITRNDTATGVTSLGDAGLLVFFRNSVQRIRDLPFLTSPNFDLTSLEITPISPTEGLAGGAHSYALFHSQRGHAMCAWVSDSGIYATDGSLPAERGLGIIRLTAHKDWRNEVDTARLTETRLVFDDELQMLIFDYYDRSGVLRTEYLHTSPLHWIPSGQDQVVPKITGPHTLTASSRSIGENKGVIRHWSLDLANERLLNERVGIDDAGSDIPMAIEWPWLLLAGSRNRFRLLTAQLFHTDWGHSETCKLQFQARLDQAGTTQIKEREGIRLRGNAITNLGILNMSGRSLRILLFHLGKTTSLQTPIRGLGPIALEVEGSDEARG